MNGLFIRLYLDEDVSVLVATLLRSRGHEVLTTRDAGRLGAPDPDQLAFAAAQGMAIVTHNRADYDALANKYAAAGCGHAGIVIAVRRSPQELARRLLQILDAVTADEMRDQTRYI
jgi:predicted nuclease of predicted toxin-antitoxin system